MIQARRGRKMDGPGEVHVRHAGIPLQPIENFPICLIEFHVQHIIPTHRYVTAFNAVYLDFVKPFRNPMLRPLRYHNRQPASARPAISTGVPP